MTGAAEPAAAQAEFWPRVTVVTVAYNSAAVIGSCLEALADAPHILIADNASSDDSADVARRTAPQAEIVATGANLGYGRGANAALEKVRSEFALLVNPDAIVDADCVARLVACADLWPEAAMIAPALVEPSGEIVRSHDAGLFSRTGMARKRDGEPLPEGPLCAGFVSGAVTLVRMAALREAGFYDPNIFLFYEDDDLCLRLRAHGWSLILAPDAVARHIGGGASGEGAPVSRVRAYHMAWSRLYLERKHRGAGAALVTGLGNVLLYAGKSLAALLRGDGNRLARDRARLAGTLAALLGRPAHDTGQGT